VDAATATTRPSLSDDHAESGDILSSAQAQHEISSKSNEQASTAPNAGSDRSKTSKRQPPRPRRGPPVRDANDIARDSFVEQILSESAVPLYDPSSTSTKPFRPAADAGGGEGEDEVDNDEAVANAFKTEFLLQQQQRRRRKPPAPPPQKGVVPVSQGPKLGGSRSQRERMKAAVAAEEASKAVGGSGGAKR